MITRPSHLVEKYLHEDEQVIFDEAPDLRAWAFSQFLDMAVVAALVVIMLMAQDSRVTTWGLLMEIGVLGAFGWRLLGHNYTRYVLTDFRAIRLSGVLRRDHEWISWRKVTDVSVHRTFADRLFGTATIRIQSANEASAFQEMGDVPNPIFFADSIVAMVNSEQAKPPPPPPGSGGSGGGGRGGRSVGA